MSDSKDQAPSVDQVRTEQPVVLVTFIMSDFKSDIFTKENSVNDVF